MKPPLAFLTASAGCALFVIALARAQQGAGDWLTAGFDAQRSSWVRSDGKISPKSMAKPGFSLIWNVKLDNVPRQLNSLTSPALIDFYIGYRGFRSLAFLSGSSNHLYAIDVDLGRLEWEKTYPTDRAPREDLTCPGGITSAVSRVVNIDYPNSFMPRGVGRGTPAKSGVGLPDEGAVTLNRRPPPVAAPMAASPARPARATPASNPYAPRVQWIRAITSDGKLHSLWISNGNEPDPPVDFLPPNTNADGLIVYNDTAYASTTNGCGNADNGIWALDLATSKVIHWKSTAVVAGTAGLAVRPNGSLYVAAGTQLTALAEHSLQQIVSYDSGGAQFSSSPVIFEFNRRDLVAATTNDGRLVILDAESLGQKAPPVKSAVFFSPDSAVGSLTTWRDPAGTRWLLVPVSASASPEGFVLAGGAIRHGAIAAWKVVDKGGALTLEPGWISRDLVSPLPPIVVNGVVFAVSSGEYRSSDPRLSAADRARRSSRAVLYALDAIDGKEVWNSEGAIASFVHSGGLAAGAGRVYVSAYDGVQLAFGFPVEH